MPTIKALPQNPREKLRNVTSLSSVLHESQRDSVARFLNIPYTTQREREKTICRASESLASQVSMNNSLNMRELDRGTGGEGYSL